MSNNHQFCNFERSRAVPSRRGLDDNALKYLSSSAPLRQRKREVQRTPTPSLKGIHKCGKLFFRPRLSFMACCAVVRRPSLPPYLTRKGMKPGHCTPGTTTMPLHDKKGRSLGSRLVGLTLLACLCIAAITSRLANDKEWPRSLV